MTSLLHRATPLRKGLVDVTARIEQTETWFPKEPSTYSRRVGVLSQPFGGLRHPSHMDSPLNVRLRELLGQAQKETDGTRLMEIVKEIIVEFDSQDVGKPKPDGAVRDGMTGDGAS
jgi:hypothetical protein